MKIIQKFKNPSLNIENNIITFSINENQSFKYEVDLDNKSYNQDVLEDLLECRGYATTLLYLNENCKLLVKDFNEQEYYTDCEDLLKENVEIVEEVGIPLCSIKSYPIFESAGYILRGAGKKKIKECFKSNINNKENIQEDFGDYKVLTKKQYMDLAKKYGEKINDYEVKQQDGKFWISRLDYNALVDSERDLQEDSEGTQCTDIAPKVDQNLNKKTTGKKKYYDILLSDINESLDIVSKGFLRNSKGQYQRGNYILVKEGENYIAIHKNKLKED